MKKSKLTPDQVAMIIADWQDGELFSCKDINCKNCVLNIVYDKKTGFTICDSFIAMSERLNDVEDEY